MAVVSVDVQLEPVQQEKHSSSAVEVAACFSQVRKIWLQLAWPDSAGAFIFITRLTDVSGAAGSAHIRHAPGIVSDPYLWRSQNFCSEAVCYSEMMTRKIERGQLGRDYKSFTVQVKPRTRQDCGVGGWGGVKQ